MFCENFTCYIMLLMLLGELQDNQFLMLTNEALYAEK
jgi:hypothetical protein